MSMTPMLVLRTIGHNNRTSDLYGPTFALTTSRQGNRRGPRSHAKRQLEEPRLCPSACPFPGPAPHPSTGVINARSSTLSRQRPHGGRRSPPPPKRLISPRGLLTILFSCTAPSSTRPAGSPLPIFS